MFSSASWGINLFQSALLVCNPAMTFSRTWQPSLWNTIIRGGDAALSQFLWEGQGGTVKVWLQVIKLPSVIKTWETLPLCGQYQLATEAAYDPTPPGLKTLQVFVSGELDSEWDMASLYYCHSLEWALLFMFNFVWCNFCFVCVQVNYSGSSIHYMV